MLVFALMINLIIPVFIVDQTGEPANDIDGSFGYDEAFLLIHPMINEVYPEPAHDTNEDGNVDTSDEFVEIFNPNIESINIRNWSISDNYGKYTITSSKIEPGEIMIFWRNETGLKLGRDDKIILTDENGTMIDELNWTDHANGFSLQRAPNGNALIRKVYHPTPGENNVETPLVKINEVMIDPLGSNPGNQWIELLNTGLLESMRGFSLTNHEGVEVNFPDEILHTDNRFLIFLGEVPEDLMKPQNVLILGAPQASSLFVNGDDLSLIDPDGRVVDHVAWGGSKHVQKVRQGYSQTEWTGKFWDDENSTMSVEGIHNPIPIEGRSISRIPDGSDTSTPNDWVVTNNSLQHTMGWNNDIDPSLEIMIDQDLFYIKEGSNKNITLTIKNTGNRNGSIFASTSWNATNWSVNDGISGDHELLINGTHDLFLNISAPNSIYPDRDLILEIEITWQGLDFILFEKIINFMIPATDVSISDVTISFEGNNDLVIPSGGSYNLHGYIQGGGEIDPGDVDLILNVRDESRIVMSHFENVTSSYHGMTTRSRRQFELTIDTLGMMGVFEIFLELKINESIEDSNIINNYWSEVIEVIPSVIPDGQMGLKIVEVLWNCTIDESFVTIINPTDSVVDISGIGLTDGERTVRFPIGEEIGPFERINVIWGEAGLRRISTMGHNYSIQKIPNILKMNADGGIPDPISTGRIILQTQYRIEIDRVLLRGSILFNEENELDTNSIETTWGSVMFRSTNRNGLPIDSNTSLDWAVHKTHCMIQNFLPEPDPSGSGEFITLTSDIPKADFSGYLILCSGRGVVIPNGTCISEDGYIAISREPEYFLKVHERIPGIHTGYDIKIDGEIVPGGRIPNLPELILPNEGSELLLIDPANNVVDSVSWGDIEGAEIGRPNRDCIVGRIQNGTSGTFGWRIVGTGSEWSGIWENDCGNEAKCVDFNSYQEAMDWIFEGDEATIISPFIENEVVINKIASFLEEQGKVELIYTYEPWSPFPGLDEKIHPILKRAGYAKYLQNEGARIRTLNSNIGPNEPTIMICGSRILFFLGKLGPLLNNSSTDLVRIVGIQYADVEMNNSVFRYIGKYRDSSNNDLDPLKFIDQIKPSAGSSPYDTTPDEEILTSMDVRLGPFLPNNLEDLTISENMLIWSSGPMDLSYLKKVADNKEIKVLIDPKFLRILGEGSASYCTSEIERMIDGCHYLSFQELEENAFLRSYALLEVARSLDLKLDIRVGDLALAKKFTTPIFSNQDEFRFLFPRIEKGDPPPSLILKGDISDLLGNSLDDDWNRARPLPKGLIDNERAEYVEEKSNVRIHEVYYDTYLADDPDEYIAIENFGNENVDLSGFMLTDDEGDGLSSDGMVILEDIIVRPGEMIFLTRELEAFTSQNGELPSIEFVSDTSVHACSCYGDLRLANSNDTLSLRDASGNIVDFVSWGSAVLPNDNGIWRGEPCPDIGWGKILSRSSRSDTNSRDDWLSLRPRYPGQSRFDLFDFHQLEAVEFGICPDSSSEVLDSILDEADQEILVNVYEMTSSWITSRLIGLKGRGVSVKVLLEGNPVGGISQMEKSCMDRMVESGIEVRLMNTDPSIGVRDRYRYDHAKYIVVDGQMVLVSSDNFKDSSFPPQNERNIYGTRGWVVALSSDETAEDLKNVFHCDWEGPDIRIIAPSDYDIAFDNFHDNLIVENDPVCPAWSNPLLIDPGGEAIVLVSPDHISKEDNPLLKEIDEAEKEILVELMDIDLDFLLSSFPENGIPISYQKDKKEYGIGVVNPYLKALLEAAKRGVEVKLLLDGSDFNGDGDPENAENVNELNKILEELDLKDTFAVMLHSSPRFSINEDITMIHNKGMIIDRRSVWISSFNWGPTSGLENREVGILLRSEEAAEYLRECVLYDMGSSLQSDLDLIKEWARGEFESDELVFIEVCLKLEWEGDEPIQFELVNIRTDGLLVNNKILDHEIIDEPFDGHLILSSDDFSTLKDGKILLRISRGELHSDLMVIEVSQPKQRSTDRERTWYANGWIPIVIILIIAILISLLKAFISKRESFEEE